MPFVGLKILDFSPVFQLFAHLCPQSNHVVALRQSMPAASLEIRMRAAHSAMKPVGRGPPWLQVGVADCDDP